MVAGKLNAMLIFWPSFGNNSARQLQCDSTFPLRRLRRITMSRCSEEIEGVVSDLHTLAQITSDIPCLKLVYLPDLERGDLEAETT